MKIAYSNHERNAHLEIIELTFDELCKNLSTPSVGTKLGAYYIRGGELKEQARKEENLLSCELLILDGDSSINLETKEITKGAPNPKVVHQFLLYKKIKHFIYTSFSNKVDHHRYRVLIPYQANNPDELRRAVAYIVKEIQDFGIPLANVSENGDWVHAWFFPALENEDSPFQTYSGEGNIITVPDDFTIIKESPASSKKDTPFDMNEALVAITTAGNIHDSMVSIANSLAFKGYDRDTIRLLLKGLLTMAAQQDPERAEIRDGAHLEQTLDTVIAYKDENDDHIIIPNKAKPEESTHVEMDWPPGLMGQMCKEAVEMAIYPNRTLAIMSCITLIAGIVGRRFNVNGTGLNIYSTLLMDTGMGKNAISKMVNSTILTNSGDNNTAPTFLGSSSFTGAKALWDDLEKGMAKICVMTEAGLMRGQTSGDKKGLERALLDLYTASGKGYWVGGTQYSSKDNSMKRLNAPALSLIQESTPKSFIDSMVRNDSDVSGDLARMWILRINTDKPYMNRKSREFFSDEVMDRINELVKQCGELQLSKPILGDKDVVDLEIPEYIYNHANKIVDLENKYKREGEHLKYVMATRAWVKMIKITGVIDVFNGHNDLKIDTFDWTDKNAISHEIQNIDILFSKETSNDVNNVVKSIVSPVIVKMLHAQYSDPKKCPPPSLRKVGIFTHTNITQVLKANRVLNEMDNKANGYKVEKGIDKVLKYMIDVGLLVEKDQSSLSMLGCRSKKGYQITDDFNLMLM